MEATVELIRAGELSANQEEFVRGWGATYFGSVPASRDLDSAPVHWRFILYDGDKLISHVAVTELRIEVDGRLQIVGSIGGLFTIRGLMGRGFGNLLMDRAEAFIFEQLGFHLGILFCLPKLIPFYGLPPNKWTVVAQSFRCVSLGSVSGFGSAC